MPTIKKILIATGGTGGHIFPACGLAKNFLDKKIDVIITSDERGLRYLNDNSYEIKIIDTPRLNNVFFLPLNLIIISLQTIKSFFLLRKKNAQRGIYKRRHEP